MPVIGHAMVGLGVAVQCEPSARRDRRAFGPLAAALWVPGVVAVSYFPDVVTQLGSMLRVVHAGLIGHSLAVGVASGAAIGGLWAYASGAPFGLMIAVSIGSILGHDLLDLLQATDRAPFWPWSTRPIGVRLIALPGRSNLEVALFVAVLLAFLAWRAWSGRSLGSLGALVGSPASRSDRRLAWIGRGVVAAIVLAATLTHALRARRERQIDVAAHLLTEGRYAQALTAADAADRWPSAVRPGRVDMMRGEALEALGEAAAAERCYLRAYDEDPTNFWAVADLAEFYAAGRGPLDERRRLAQPYIDELRDRFPRHRQLPIVLARVDRKLAGG